MPIRWHPHPTIDRPDFQINGFPPLSRTANSLFIHRLLAGKSPLRLAQHGVLYGKAG
jgi:hypothetical protein